MPLKRENDEKTWDGMGYLISRQTLAILGGSSGY
jgi:hypothetical protein